MRLAILAVGHKLPDWVAAGCAEYIKRMPRELPVSVTEIKPEPRGTKSREQLLAAEKVLIVQGTGFNWPNPDHFRLVFLPNCDDLTEAIGRIAHFLGQYRKRNSP